MGQEQSYVGHANVAQVNKYRNKYEDPVHYRGTPINYRNGDFKDTDYKRHKARKSAGSYKSDISSTESSGYRSGSSSYEYRSDISSKSDYYCTSLYKNDHYKDVNKELYKPVKIKEKKIKVQLFDKDELKSERLNSYLSEVEKVKLEAGPAQKKIGIRNYTPKILTEEEQKKKTDWK